MPDLFPPTLDDQREAVRREIRYREKVYPRQITGGRMSQGFADKQIALMRAVLTTLEGIKGG